jgi:hypothetical protein
MTAQRNELLNLFSERELRLLVAVLIYVYVASSNDTASDYNESFPCDVLVIRHDFLLTRHRLFCRFLRMFLVFDRRSHWVTKRLKGFC